LTDDQRFVQDRGVIRADDGLTSRWAAITMTPAIRQAYRSSMELAQDARRRGDFDGAFHALERAHILSQRYLIPHIMTHLQMLHVGWLRRDRREIIGQLMRLFATIPGYMTGWVPKGNPGGANISAMRPMPLSGDLAVLMQDYHVWHDVARRLALLGALVLGAMALLWEIDRRHQAAAAALDAEWVTRPKVRVDDFGTTSFLEVLPIVNWKGTPGLRTEPGVSYLIRTDQYTILFDLGFNREQTSPSPLEHNLRTLGIALDDVDAIFFSHVHRDHVGGTQWERAKSFSIGLDQAPLNSDLRILAPVPMTYPGSRIDVATQAQAWLPGLATTGPIPRQLILGRIDEQALLIHVAGRGLVAIVGCGHQTVPKLLQHIEASFSVPLVGLIGDLHYPVPEGRLFIAGIDAQRRVASGRGLFATLPASQVEQELAQLSERLSLFGLGSHDTSDEVLAHAAERFGDRYRPVVAGQSIVWSSPGSL